MGGGEWVSPLTLLVPLAVPSSMGWKSLPAHLREGAKGVILSPPLTWPASSAANSFQPVDLGAGSYDGELEGGGGGKKKLTLPPLPHGLGRCCPWLPAQSAGTRW